MSTDCNRPVGFQPPCRDCARKRRGIACAELILSVALAVSTVVALTAVSIGIARADSFGAIIAGDGSPFGVALLLGSLLALMGGLTAFVTRMGETRPRR